MAMENHKPAVGIAGAGSACAVLYLFGKYLSFALVAFCLVVFCLAKFKSNASCTFGFEDSQGTLLHYSKYTIYYATRKDNVFSQRQRIDLQSGECRPKLALPVDVTKIRIEPKREGGWGNVAEFPRLRFQVGAKTLPADMFRLQHFRYKQLKYVGYDFTDEKALKDAVSSIGGFVYVYVFILCLVFDIIVRMIVTHSRMAFMAVIGILAVFPTLHFSEEDKSIRENRNRATFPKASEFSVEDPSVFCAAFERAFSDRFLGRDSLMYACDWIRNCFDLPEGGKAAFGHDNWMFLASTLPNARKVQEESVELGIAAYLKSFAEWAKSKNKKFVVFIAPDKSRVYDDKLRFVTDFALQRAEVSLADWVVNRISDAVTVCYPRQVIKDCRKKAKHELYYKHDTHWNQEGAYYGCYVPVMEAVSVEVPRIVESWQDEVRPAETGDLVNMCAKVPDEWLEDDCVGKPRYAGPQPHVVVKEPGNPCSDIEATGAGSKGRLFCFRDSFMIHPLWYFSRVFSDSHFVWRYQVKQEDLPCLEKADVILFEIVERNLPLLCGLKLPAGVN